MRWRCGNTVSKRVTAWPASARLSVRAARKMVSPSGTGVASFAFVVLVLIGDLKHRRRYWRYAPHLEAEHRLDKARISEEAREVMLARGLPIDFANQQS